MKKTLILLSVIILTSCGPRKVNKQELETKQETKTEVKEVSKSLDSTKTETEEQSSAKINFEVSTKDFLFEPIDNTKPFFIGSQKYENVKVVNKESNSKYLEETELLKKQTEYRFSQLENTIESLIEENKELKSNVKQVDKKESLVSLFMWLSILLLIILLLIYAYNKYLKTK
tara:strand:- start:9417 stop:9935 length:519 start_codon:yes stop_codon:yes gene_type:complete